MSLNSFWQSDIQVPQSYTDLQQAVIEEAERRRSTGEPPILLEDEILQLAKSSPQNDILDTEELTLGWYSSLILSLSSVIAQVAVVLIRLVLISHLRSQLSSVLSGEKAIGQFIFSVYPRICSHLPQQIVLKRLIIRPFDNPSCASNSLFRSM